MPHSFRDTLDGGANQGAQSVRLKTARRSTLAGLLAAAAAVALALGFWSELAPVLEAPSVNAERARGIKTPAPPPPERGQIRVG